EVEQSGYARFDVDDGPHRFEVRVSRAGPVRIFGVAAERNEPGVVVDTPGINGARARYHLLWDQEIFAEHVRRRDPDLVVLAYGTNESGDTDEPIERYEDDLRRVLTNMREMAPRASCLLVGPSDRPLRDRKTGTVEPRPRVTEVNDTQ